MCHQIRDAQCLRTRTLQTHNAPHIPHTPAMSPPESVALSGEAWGQKLGVNLEVVVPDWLFDLTDCHWADVRYDQRSGVKESVKTSQLTSAGCPPPQKCTFDLMSCDYSNMKCRDSDHWSATNLNQAHVRKQTKEMEKDHVFYKKLNKKQNKQKPQHSEKDHTAIYIRKHKMKTHRRLQESQPWLIQKQAWTRLAVIWNTLGLYEAILAADKGRSLLTCCLTF